MSLDITLKFTEEDVNHLSHIRCSAFHIEQQFRFFAIGDQQMTLNEFPEEKDYYMYWTKTFIACKILNEWCIKSGFKSIMLFDYIDDVSCNNDDRYLVLTNWKINRK